VAAVAAADSTVTFHYQQEFVSARAVAAVEITTVVPLLGSRVEPEEGSFLLPLTPSPTSEQSVQTVRMAPPLRTEGERAEAAQAAAS
jgi:hypothetical protein